MNDKSETIKEESLNLSYWEHFKASQEAHRALGAEHPKSLQLQQVTNQLILKINSNKVK